MDIIQAMQGLHARVEPRKKAPAFGPREPYQATFS